MPAPQLIELNLLAVMQIPSSEIVLPEKKRFHFFSFDWKPNILPLQKKQKLRSKTILHPIKIPQIKVNYDFLR